MSTREENHEYALAIIEAKNADIRVLQGAIHKLTSALIEAGVERSTLRAERDALRTVDDAMVERAWKAIADVCGVVCYNDDGEYMPRHHINLVEREDVRAALTAALSASPALAVQPTTGEGNE